MDPCWKVCCKCRRKRKLPKGFDVSRLPENWFCYMNPDPRFRCCTKEEHSTADKPSCQNTYMHNEKYTKSQQEGITVSVQSSSHHPGRSNTRSSPLTTGSSPLNTFILTQTGTSSSSKEMPIISSVYSLSTLLAPLTPTTPLTPLAPLTALSTPSRMKRTQARTSDRDPKTPRLDAFHQNTVTKTTTPVVFIPVIDYDDDIMDNNDSMTSTTCRTPIAKPTFDLARVKSEISPVKTSGKTGSSTTSSSPPTPPQVSITTQTEKRNVVKVEEEEERKTEEQRKMRRTKSDPTSTCQSTPGPSTPGPSTPGPATPGPSTPGPSTPGPSTPGPSTPGPSTPGPSTPGPSDRPVINLSEAQEQQDQLLVLMASTAQERDQYKEQVHKLTCRLRELEVKLQEMSQAAVKRELCLQACQTEEGSGEGKQVIKVNEESKTLEEERGNLWSQIKVLQRDVVALKKEKQEWECGKLEREAAQTAAAQNNSMDCQSTKATSVSLAPQRELKQLRRSIGCLLVKFIPGLNLEHVNYNCPDIDKILNQVNNQLEPMEKA
ncbi:hypothetical protein UPYG_G00307800 [Umbra pygmaea]|uniref:CW-type domain-containing protein n=1 Tax=Umbra pygmaea TaxID=75934 RepID=A0ABD0WIM3_UMBPY